MTEKLNRKIIVIVLLSILVTAAIMLFWGNTYKSIAAYEGNIKKYALSSTEQVEAGLSRDILDWQSHLFGWEHITLNGVNISLTESYFEPKYGSVTFTKEWNDENYEINRPDITVYLVIGDDENDTPVPGTEVTLTVADNGRTAKVWNYTWDNLLIQDINGNAVTYSVVEKSLADYTMSRKENLVIDNTYKLPVQQAGQITMNILGSKKEVKVPLDVVFILDVSGSMQGSKASDMVSATNAAIAQILGYNTYNRISVVTFSGSSDTLLDLRSDYTPRTGSNYLTISDNTISTNVTQTRANRDVVGTTYTQSGIREGSDVLTSSSGKTVTIDGETVKRTPVVILLSDGEPTCYTTAYSNVGTPTENAQSIDNNGYSAIYGYYTVLTANYYKNAIRTAYDNTTHMYTIGMGISDNNLYAKTILSPTSANVTACQNSGTSDEEELPYNLYTSLEESKCMYIFNDDNWRLTNNNLITTANPYLTSGYNYSDGYYGGRMDSETLADIMKSIVDEVLPDTQTRRITDEEIRTGKVYLDDIDISAVFSLIADLLTCSTCADTMAREILILDETLQEYYIDLTKIPAGSTLMVEYTSV